MAFDSYVSIPDIGRSARKIIKLWEIIPLIKEAQSVLVMKSMLRDVGLREKR
jgi:hypothetical protein